MINWIREQFCKHEFEHVNSTSIRKVKIWTTDTHYIDTYMCKKCGYVRKIKT